MFTHALIRIRKVFIVLIFTTAMSTIGGISQVCAGVKDEAVLVILSARKEPLVQPVIDLFQEQTGIKVVLKSGQSPALSQQILQELPHSSADIFLAKEVGALEYLRLKDALEVYQSEATKQIPPQFTASDGTWIGVSGRARAIIYNKDLVKEADVPRKLADLFDPKWKGKIAATNAGNESIVAWVSALRLKLGEEKTKDILLQLKANDIRLLSDSHTDVRKAVGRGEYSLGLINHYYYHLQKHETDPAITNVGIVYLDQGPDEQGELVNVAGAAIVKGAPHLSHAQKFMDFLVSTQVQKLFAEVNFEYPLVAAVETHPEVLESVSCRSASMLDCLHKMDVDLDKLGSMVEETTRLLDEVQWN